MILDFSNVWDHAFLYDVFDAVTGEKLSDSFTIFYADDTTGVYRVYLRNDDGSFYIDLDTGEIAWEERRRANGLRFARNDRSPE